jgi:hypothetical protein
MQIRMDSRCLLVVVVFDGQDSHDDIARMQMMSRSREERQMIRVMKKWAIKRATRKQECEERTKGEGRTGRVRVESRSSNKATPTHKDRMPLKKSERSEREREREKENGEHRGQEEAKIRGGRVKEIASKE